MPALKEVFKSDIPFKDIHEAECLFFNCCDFRFRKQVQEFLGSTQTDPFVFPGGVMLFVGGKHGHSDMKEGALYWTKAMVGLHHIKEIKLVIHQGCGAYKAAPKLSGKSAEEIYDIQLSDVKEVVGLVKAEIPEVKVTAYYMQPAENNQGVVFSEILFD